MDRKNIAQLVVWVRVLKWDKFAAAMLALLPLMGQYQIRYFYSALTRFFHGPAKTINWGLLPGTTDRAAPSMVGKRSDCFAHKWSSDAKLLIFGITNNCAANEEVKSSKWRWIPNSNSQHYCGKRSFVPKHGASFISERASRWVLWRGNACGR